MWKVQGIEDARLEEEPMRKQNTGSEGLLEQRATPVGPSRIQKFTSNRLTKVQAKKGGTAHGQREPNGMGTALASRPRVPMP